ncbi:MAG: hypothetical protein EXR79_15285 [Myxococcales bacterium]|nr:hypothetical protein [Myxococcales bacterium]
MPRTATRTAALIAGLIALLATSACSEAPPPLSATATAPKCEAQSDCANGFSCDTAKKICVKLECDDLKGPKCPSGKTCKAGTCVNAFGTDGAATTDAGDASATGDGAAPDPDASAPADGSITDATAPVGDTANPAAGDKSCNVCKEDVDCGAAFGCVTLLNPGTKFCARKCSESSQCLGGFSCEDLSTDPKKPAKHCILPTWQCDGCAVDGCTGGDVCNYKATPPKCIKAGIGKECGECKLDSECDVGFRCVKIGSAKACAPECNSKACPAKSTCTSFAGVSGKVCAFQAAACCYGAQCTVGCATCGAEKCVGGKCVECLADADCKGGKCSVAEKSCISSGACADDKPIKLATGVCVECTNDSHCAGSKVGPKCNLATNACEQKSASNECAVCKDPYPACVEQNGQWSCVECKTDDNCKTKNAGTCSAKTYTCSGTIGTGTGPDKGTCKGDGDCKNAGTTNFDLACDVATGLCYDTKGKCDNVVAFCNAKAGSSCKIAEGGGLPGGIPGMPGGGGGAPGGAPGVGSCSCPGSSGGGGGATMKPECELVKAFDPKLKTCDCAKDPANPDCKNILLGDCCAGAGGGGGGGGGAGNPMACLSKSQGSASPACFGGIKCSELFNCILGQPGGTCGDGGLPFP